MSAFLAFLLACYRFLIGADFLPRARCTGAVTLVDLSGYQPGVDADEAGINVETFDVTYKPSAKEYLKNRVGDKIGFSVNALEAEITVDGEVNASTGLMAAGFTTAVTLANVTNQFGLSAGGIYMDEVAIKQNREPGKLMSASFKFSKNALIA